MKPYITKWWFDFLNKIQILLKTPELNTSQNMKSNPNASKTIINENPNNAAKKAEFVQLIMDLESDKITETDLRLDQLEILIKYYDTENNKLEEHIKNQENMVKELNLKLNKKYEKAIKLKMNNL